MTKCVKVEGILKSKLKWGQNLEKQIKMNIIANHCSSNNLSNVWHATNKLNIKPGLPASDDGICGSKGIINLFKEHFIVNSILGPTSLLLDAGTTVAGNLFVLRELLK